MVWRRAAGSSAHRDRAKAFACDLFASQFWLYVIHTTSPQERPAAQTNLPPSISTSWITRVRHYQGHLPTGSRWCEILHRLIFEAAFGRRRVDCVGFLTTLRGRQQMRGGCDFKLCCCRWFFSRPDHSSTKSIWKVMQLQTAVWII